MFIEKRSIPKAIIYSIITCGIYAIYWMYKLTEEAHELAGEQTTATGGMVILYTFITCGIYGLYWVYKMGVTVNMAKEKRGLRNDDSVPVIYLVLSIFGLAIVSYAMLQDGLNEVIAHDAQSPAL